MFLDFLYTAKLFLIFLITHTQRIYIILNLIIHCNLYITQKLIFFIFSERVKCSYECLIFMFWLKVGIRLQAGIVVQIIFLFQVFHLFIPFSSQPDLL